MLSTFERYQRIAPVYDVLDLPFEYGRYRQIRRFAHGFILAMNLRFLGGIGLAGVHMPGLNQREGEARRRAEQCLLMDRIDRSVQGRAAGIYTSSYAAGSAGSFLIAGLVDAAFGWRATFIVAGIGPLLSICACSRVVCTRISGIAGD